MVNNMLKLTFDLSVACASQVFSHRAHDGTGHAPDDGGVMSVCNECGRGVGSEDHMSLVGSYECGANVLGRFIGSSVHTPSPTRDALSSSTRRIKTHAKR